MENNLFIKEIRLNNAINSADNFVYPFSLPIVRHLNKVHIEEKVTFLAGENGSGKSTLLEAVAVNFGFNPEGGSKNFNFSTKDTHSVLHEYITLVKGAIRPKDGFFLRTESFYNIASEVEELDLQYGDKSLHAMSHGEGLLSLMENRFWGNGLYILDEPEAALSPQKQLELLVLINELVNKNSQFIIATHSPIIMAFPGAQIYVLTENGFDLTPYKQTQHYNLTKQFLDNPDRMLKYLFE